MRVLITGATGFLGSHIARGLVQEGHTVAALIRPEASEWRIASFLDRLTIVRGELRAVTLVMRELELFAPEAVIHAGWIGSAGRARDDVSHIAPNVLAALQLLELATETRSEVWIGIGSQAEYGPTDEILVETMIPKPETAYGAAKLAIGLMSEFFAARRNLRTVWLRLTAAYGPFDDPGHLIPYTTLSLLRRARPRLTDGHQLWDYLYVDDAVSAIQASLLDPGIRGIYNLGSGSSATVRVICEFLRDQIDPSLALGFGELDSGPLRRRRLQANITRFAVASGWRPLINLEEGLGRTIYAHRVHPRGDSSILPTQGTQL